MRTVLVDVSVLFLVVITAAIGEILYLAYSRPIICLMRESYPEFFCIQSLQRDPAMLPYLFPLLCAWVVALFILVRSLMET
jgi:hypothetical protein